MSVQNKYSTERRLRHFLIWVAAFIFVGTVFELILIEHYMKTPQLIPYILSGIGLTALFAARLKPNRKTVIALRWIMVTVALGSLLGIYFHFTANLAWVRSINPTFSLSEALWPAMKGGNPLMAPGVLFLAGVLGIGVTYEHPVLRD